MPHRVVTTQNLLESVITITEQRSREHLEHCLVRTVLELTDLTAVSLVHPLRSMPDPYTRPGLFLEYRTHMERLNGELVALPHQTMPCDALIQRSLDARQEVWERTPHGTIRHCLPILAQENLLAVLLVEGSEDLDAQLTIVRGLGRVYRNFLTILHDAERDTLTGLQNRKTFDDNINRIIARCHPPILPPPHERRQAGESQHHWLGIIDIDHFKRINDTFGHIFGDEVLLLFASLMRKTFRTDDQLFRFGGEEFVAILAPMSYLSAQGTFERFRQTVETFPFPQVGQVTTSVGFVRISPRDIPTSVVGQADEALYWAKNHGRNRVCGYESLVGEGKIIPAQATGSIELF